MRPCLDCHRRTHGTRCLDCERRAQQKRNAAVRYRRTRAWRALSKAAREAQPWCSRCGSGQDLTVDHVVNRSLAGGVMVLCRRCNGAKG